MRWISDPPTLGDKIYIIWLKFKSLFTRYKIVNTVNNYILNKETYKRTFIFSEKEYETYQLYKKKNEDVWIKRVPDAIGNATYLKVGDTIVNITDYDVW